MGEGRKLKIRLEPASESIKGDALKEAVSDLTSTIKWQIGITPEVEIVGVNTLRRFEHKARRVIKEE